VEPNQIGRYLVKNELGRGGMATVFLAHDPSMSRDVAIKVLPRQFLHDPQFLGRFKREAKVIASLEHPAIVPVYDFGDVDGQPYLVMRYMNGGSLSERIKEGPLSISGASKIITRIASALDEAHARGMIHRDLKPGNILFDNRGDAYLSDFGIVKLAESTDTYTGSGIIGTPTYISPEQVHGDKVLDGRSDIYSLGIILFQMLSGRAPYVADTPGKLLMAHVMDPVPSILSIRSDLPADCETIFLRSLAKDREQRYRTAGEMAAELQAVADNKNIPPPSPELSSTQLARPAYSEASASPATTATRPPKEQARRPRRAWIIGGGLVILLLAICGVAIVAGALRGILPTSPDVEEATETIVAAATSTASPRPATATQPPATAALNLTLMPTNTPKATPSRLAIPSPTIAELNEATQLELVVDFSSINVRSGPGVNYNIVATMTRGETAIVIARTEDNAWYNIIVSGEDRGWVSTSVVSLLEGRDTEDVPVAATIPSESTTRSTATPTVAPYGSNNFTWVDPFYEANQGRHLSSEESLKPLAQLSSLLLLLIWFMAKRRSQQARLPALRRHNLLLRLLTLMVPLLSFTVLRWIRLL